MSWNFASSDRSVALNFQADGDTGRVLGTLTVAEGAFIVFGSWVASGSLGTGNLRPYSAFSVSTKSDPNKNLAATGIVAGPGGAPTRIDIQVDTVSFADGTSHHYPQVSLFPV